MLKALAWKGRPTVLALVTNRTDGLERPSYGRFCALPYSPKQINSPACVVRYSLPSAIAKSVPGRWWDFGFVDHVPGLGGEDFQASVAMDDVQLVVAGKCHRLDIVVELCAVLRIFLHFVFFGKRILGPE